MLTFGYKYILFLAFRTAWHTWKMLERSRFFNSLFIQQMYIKNNIFFKKNAEWLVG